jgi:hypothetical protein
MTRARPDPSGEHAHIAAELPFLVNGTLEPAEAALARDHLRRCAECRQQFELETALMASMREQTVIDYAPHAPLAKLMVRIDEHAARRERRGWWRVLRRRHIRLRDAVILAQAMAIVVLVMVIGNPGWRDPAGANYRTLTRAETTVQPDAPRLRLVLDDQVRALELRQMLGTIGGTVVDGPSPQGVFTIALRASPADSPEEPEAVADWLRAQPGVRFAEVVQTGATGR